MEVSGGVIETERRVSGWSNYICGIKSASDIMCSFSENKVRSFMALVRFPVPVLKDPHGP